MRVSMVVVVLALSLVSFATINGSNPHGGWDAVQIWNLRARFLFRGDVDGVKRVIVDYRRGRVLAAGGGSDFGDLAPGAQPLRFTLYLGAAERSVTVRAVRRGKKLGH